MISPIFNSDLAVVVLEVFEALSVLEALAVLVVVLAFDALALLVFLLSAFPPQAANESTITADMAIAKNLFFISFLLF